MEKRWSEIQLWMDYARKFAARLALTRDPPYVSVNDLYEGVMSGQLPPPPDVPIERRGRAMCAVFTVDAFRNTGKMISGTNPRSRYRKVAVFEYMPFVHGDDWA